MVKLYTARQAIALASETLEAFGGAGYVEDTGLPRLLRDTQVLSIWEGTTNVLSLDALRAIDKEAALGPLLEDVRARLKSIQAPSLLSQAETVRKAAGRIEDFHHGNLTQGPDFAQAGARGFAYSLARTYAASLLLEHADWLLKTDSDRRGAIVAARWCCQELTPIIHPAAAHRAESADLARDTNSSTPP